MKKKMAPKRVPTKEQKLHATRLRIPTAMRKRQTTRKKRRSMRGPIQMNPRGAHSPARVEKA